MVDPGEVVSATLKREFKEEASPPASDEDEEEEDTHDKRSRIRKVLFTGERGADRRKSPAQAWKHVLDTGCQGTVYCGYVDDPRNTDNAVRGVGLRAHAQPRDDV